MPRRATPVPALTPPPPAYATPTVFAHSPLLPSLSTASQEHTPLFREKTTRLVHVGGAELIPEDQRADPNQALAPDPEAANNKQDLQSAERLYEFAQRHSVPMVILSRHLQRECSLPRQLFDALGETGEQPTL